MILSDLRASQGISKPESYLKPSKCIFFLLNTSCFPIDHLFNSLWWAMTTNKRRPSPSYMIHGIKMFCFFVKPKWLQLVDYMSGKKDEEILRKSQSKCKIRWQKWQMASTLKIITKLVLLLQVFWCTITFTEGNIGAGLLNSAHIKTITRYCTINFTNTWSKIPFYVFFCLLQSTACCIFMPK